MRVLITSAGKKVRLVREFQKAGAFVIAQDLDPTSPACLIADKVADNDNELDLIIPTRDAELKMFCSTPKALVSSKYTLDMCQDKSEFARFCRRHGFKIPVTGVYEMICKPRSGSGSRGIIYIDRSYVCQEVIKGQQEYTIDYFADFEGNPISVIPRKRLNIVDGESQACELVTMPHLVAEATRMGKELKIIGPATMQCFYDGTVTWIEVNARFGGGSHFTWPLFNSPKWLVENYKCLSQKKPCTM